MSNWDKMDKRVWEESEVMNEFEKIMKKSQQSQEIKQKLNQINTSVQDASKSMSSFLDMAKNLAMDSGTKEELSNYDEEEITQEDQDLAKEKLLEELNFLASKAIEEKNYKLAYRIERTIDSVLFED